jgi:hypothetical protein
VSDNPSPKACLARRLHRSGLLLVKYHAGILSGSPNRDDHVELLILAHTPGIQFYWISAAVRLNQRQRVSLIEMIDDADTSEFRELGRENFASVEPGDGWKMLEAVCPDYAKEVPLWSQLELRDSPRTDLRNALLLRVIPARIKRWRTKAIFDELTGRSLLRT